MLAKALGEIPAFDQLYARDGRRGTFFASVLNLPQVHSLLSSEHFSVDGTLIEAWAA